MAGFKYEALDAAGKVKKGSVTADNIELARQEVKRQGLVVLNVAPETALTKDISIQIGGKPKPRDMSIFCRQFVGMSRAGVTLVDNLKMLCEQTENEKLKTAIEGVKTSVEKGETFANSLKAYPKIFPELFVNMVAAGEASGSLEIAMERMSEHFEKSAKTTALVKKAMIYPIVVCVVAIAVVAVMLIKVIPNFTSMFETLGTDLPGITKAVKGASDFVVSKWPVLLAIIIGLAIGIKSFAATDKGKHIFHKIVLMIPMFKGLIMKQNSSQMARTMSTLMAAGVPLMEAVAIAGKTMNNVYYKEAMDNCKNEIIIGQPLSRPLEKSGLFPPMVYHMVRIGEETGNTEDMLSKLADYYDEEVEAAVQALMAALEPMIIVLLAGVVIVLIGACMAPMLTMYQALDNL